MSDDITRPATDAAGTPLPPHLKKWNWGAFLLNWVWGLGNNVYVALLMFIPGVNMVMPFVLGFKGNEWAWQKGNWASEQHFERTQRLWTRVGIGVAIGFPTFVAAIFAMTTIGMQHTEPFILSFDLLRNNGEVIAELGEPIELDSWIISGSINYENAEGHADLTYEVAGPRGSGVARFVARLMDERWDVLEHTLTQGPDGDVIDLVSQTHAHTQKTPVLAQSESLSSRNRRQTVVRARLQTLIDHVIETIPAHVLAKAMAAKMPWMPKRRLPT